MTLPNKLLNVLHVLKIWVGYEIVDYDMLVWNLLESYYIVDIEIGREPFCG